MSLTKLWDTRSSLAKEHLETEDKEQCHLKQHKL